MGTRTLSENHLVEDATVKEDDIEAFLRLPKEQRFQVLRTLRHEASLLAGGGLGPMAGIYFAAVVASLPLLTALSLQGDKQWTMAVSVAVGKLMLISGLYLTFQVVLTQRRYARSATRLAFYEEALQKMPDSNSRSSSRGARWFTRAWHF
ncbi:hypothetical protein [Pseudarthrobacter sp. fls2-241-R2A-168]|uniref:hypothetical protein n=1 Tax=Pseudarthrobacter sp. fls2-241-R2A-168 TaxID=3040304 RepID=UPI002557B5FA|nr:hypothetical protein [Pseudarthrobacter sp. fls2-241-R2A-168]